MNMMKALVIEAPFRAEVKQVPIPVPKPDEVLIQVERVGICGTDIHIYRGEYVSAYPIIPGHELAGVVAQVGDDVTDFEIGDRVTAEPNIHCGRCAYCLTHRGNHCDNWQAVGVTTDGGMAEYVVVPARNVFSLPDNISFGTGAFIEPLACVVYAMNRLRLAPAARVLIFGAGAMGQQLIQALARSGASELAVVDLSARKLSMAKQWGATKTVLYEQFDRSALLSDGPRGFDVVVDATGIPAVIEQALQYLGPAGTYLQFGVAPKTEMIQLSPFELFQNDWTLIGSMATNNTFHQALHWAKEERIILEPLVTKVAQLADLPDLFANGAGTDELKVQIELR